MEKFDSGRQKTQYHSGATEHTDKDAVKTIQPLANEKRLPSAHKYRLDFWCTVRQWSHHAGDE